MIWYEEDIKRLEEIRRAITDEPETIFYGSSSIRQWTTLGADFAGYKPVNLGFGGSTLAACSWFFNRVMEKYQPKRLVIYAGDNDLGDGRHPEEVYIFFRDLAVRVQEKFGDTPCYFISLKPSIARWNIVEQFKFTNTIIYDEISRNLPNWHYVNIYNQMLDSNGKPRKEYYSQDGLHLSEKGYAVWTAAVTSMLSV